MATRCNHKNPCGAAFCSPATWIQTTSWNDISVGLQNLFYPQRRSANGNAAACGCDNAGGKGFQILNFPNSTRNGKTRDNPRSIGALKGFVVGNIDAQGCKGMTIKQRNSDCSLS